MSKELVDAKTPYLALILIGEICKDSVKYSKMKKALISSGYKKKIYKTGKTTGKVRHLFKKTKLNSIYKKNLINKCYMNK